MSALSLSFYPDNLSWTLVAIYTLHEFENRTAEQSNRIFSHENITLFSNYNMLLFCAPFGFVQSFSSSKQNKNKKWLFNAHIRIMVYIYKRLQSESNNTDIFSIISIEFSTCWLAINFYFAIFSARLYSSKVRMGSDITCAN